MKKLSRAEIYQKVVETLRKGFKNINSISTETGIRWETVKVTIESLHNTGFVKKEDTEYILIDRESLEKDTILGIPLEESKKKLICSIANRIKILKPTYSKTYMQKAVIEVLKKAKINNIPYGWYLYGECCALKLEDSVLNKYEATQEYDIPIKQVINEFEPHHNSDDLLDYLYNKARKELYVSKLDLTRVLKKEFTEETITSVDKSLKRIMWRMSKENDEAKDYYNIFYSIFSRLKKLDLSRLEPLRYDIMNAFNAVWELIGTQEYLVSLSQFYSFNIKPYYDLRMESLKDIAGERLEELEQNCPPLRSNPALEKFKGSL